MGLCVLDIMGAGKMGSPPEHLPIRRQHIPSVGIGLTLALSLSVAWLPSTRAESPPNIASPPMEYCRGNQECIQHAEAAEVAFGNRDFASAQARYKAAYSLVPTPHLLLRIGRSQHLAGQPADALQSYEQLSKTTPDLDHDLAVQLRRYRDMARATSIGMDRNDGLTDDGVRAQPLYRQGWFWAAVSLSVSGLAIGLGLALAPTQRVEAVWTP